MDSFTWKGQDSYRDFGIVITQKPPIVKAEKNVEEIEVPGKSGDITIDYGTYKPITFPMACTLLDDSNIDNVKSWLDGYDRLIFSWQNDKAYDAKLISRFDISQSLETLGEFQLIFKAQPFANTYDCIGGYNNYGFTTNFAPNNPKSLTIPICSPDIDTEPLITLIGQGDVTLTFGNDHTYLGKQIVIIKNIVDYVKIDSHIQECYREDALCNNDMIGDFPIIPAYNKMPSNWSGQYPLLVEGNITQITIQPNYVYL